MNGEKPKPITPPNVINSSSDDTDSLLSTLNGDSVDGSATTQSIAADKTKSSGTNGRRAWSDLGGQNSEEENENNTGSFVLIERHFFIY